MKLLRIDYPDIAWHTYSVMMHVFGTCALLGYLAGMPRWTLPFSLLALAVIFYTGYYFEIGFRARRWQEFRYGGEKEPKRIFDFVRWRERRDKNLENKTCNSCGKIFCPLTPNDRFCSETCRADMLVEENLGDA